MLFEKVWQNRQMWYWSVIGWICFIRRFWKRNHFGFFKFRRKKTKNKKQTFFSMHKLKTYVSESIMYGNDNFCNCLLIPSRPDYFSFFGFEHLYTFALGSINNSDTDRKWLLKTFAVRFFGMSAEVERCPFVNTFRARHTDAILLSRSMNFWKFLFWLFSHDFLNLIS